MPKKLRADAIAPIVGTLYPTPYDAPCRARERRKLGDAAGLTQYGVNLLTLPPGAWSAQRHYHSAQDEFVYVLEGTVTLVADEGEEELFPGDAAGFKAGDANGHCLQNRSSARALVLEIGTRNDVDTCHYPGIDLVAPAGGKPAMYTHVDGTPYENIRRRGPE